MTESISRECRETLAGISAYLDADLDAAVGAAIERHCQDCPPCAAIVSGLRETIGLCRETAAAPLPESVRERARERVRQLLDQAEHER